MFETTVRDGVLQMSAPRATWLSTGWDGGYRRGDVAYNITVPSGWDRRDLTTYIEARTSRAGFDRNGPALLTGIDVNDAVGARLSPVTVVATVGISNPASLPLEPTADEFGSSFEDEPSDAYRPVDSSPEIGTVNLIVGTHRSLDEGGLATLLGVVVEAKAATLQQLTGFTGTTSDAAIVATNPDGEPSTFAGSATRVGDAARAAVRDAVREGLENRYTKSEIPDSVEAADSGIETNRSAALFEV